MYNTPPCWCIYMTGLVMNYLENEIGGLENMQKRNAAKAKVLYDYLDGQDFYKNPDFLVKIDEAGPFYAAQNYAMFMTVMGGLRTSKDMEVCDENDQPIPGLFNVGAMVGDMYANTYNFAIPGNSYGINCLTFGYLLGRDLAAGKFA